MTLLLSALKPFLLSPGKPLLRQVPGSAPPPVGGGGWQGATFADVSGAWARWQADALGDFLNNPTAWGGSATGLKDRSGNGRNLAGATATAAPRVNRTYGALSLLDPAARASVAGADLRGNAGWTLALVFTRADYKANPRASDAHVLADLDGVRLLQVTERATSNVLTLFPSGANRTLKADVARSVSYGLVLRNTPGQGVTAWLVDTDTGAISAAATGVACPITATGTLRLLSDAGGSGRLHLHQAGLWARACTDNEVATLVDACRQYKLGRRLQGGVLFIGQSWAGYAVGNDGVVGDVARAVQGMIGGPGFGMVDVDPHLWNGSTCDAYGLAGASGGTPDVWTTQGGQPVWDRAGNNGPFLDSTSGTANIATWPFGWTGQGLQRFIQNVMTAEDRRDVSAVLHWHNEEDGQQGALSQLANHKAAMRRFMGLVRGELGRSAASLPWCQVAAFPYKSNSDGHQMINRAWLELSQESDQNFAVVLGNTSDVEPRDGTDWDHPAQADQQRWARLAAYGVARVLIDRGQSDSLAAAQAPGRGPEVIHAYAESSTTTIVTVLHDRGANLKLNGNATTGAGWWVNDNGTERAVSGAALVAGHQVRLTHAACTGTAAQRLIGYCTRGERTGRGNVITDDWSSTTKPSDYDIPALLGSTWNVDFPLRAMPVPIASSSAAYGGAEPPTWTLDTGLSDDFDYTGAPDSGVWHNVYALPGANGGTYDIDPAQISVAGGVCTITTAYNASLLATEDGGLLLLEDGSQYVRQIAAPLPILLEGGGTLLLENGGSYAMQSNYVPTSGPALPVLLETGDILLLESGDQYMQEGNSGAGWVSGAMMTGGTAQGQPGFLYGQVDVRARADAGQGWGPNILLWPADDSWPPEIDILEAPEADKSKAWAVLHWPPGGQDGGSYPVDVTQWHVYSLRWTAGRLEWSVDGLLRRTWTSNVPDIPMQVGLQGFVAAPDDTWYGGGPTGAGPFKLEIDYVRVFRLDASSLASNALTDDTGAALLTDAGEGLLA